jgi:hypothetical protein
MKTCSKMQMLLEILMKLSECKNILGILMMENSNMMGLAPEKLIDIIQPGVNDS